MKKKSLLILAAIFVAAGVFTDARADKKSDDFISALVQKIASWDTYGVEFSITMGEQSLSGTYQVSGESYHITTPWTEVYSNGRTKWEVSRIDREIFVDDVDPSDKTVLSNPARVFDFLDDPNIEVSVSAAGGLPVRIVYKNMNSDATVDIEKITPNVTLDAATFEFNSRNYPGFEVIDFR